MKNIDFLVREIDIKNDKCLHGNSEWFENLRRMLLSENKTDAEKLYLKLDNNIILQGHLYDAVFPAIQCICLLCTNSSSVGLAYGLDLANQIVYGNPDNDLLQEAKILRISCSRECYKISGFLLDLLVGKSSESIKISSAEILFKCFNDFDDYNGLIILKKCIEEVINFDDSTILRASLKSLLENELKFLS